MLPESDESLLDNLLKQVAKGKTLYLCYSLLSNANMSKNENIHSNILAMLLSNPENEFSKEFVAMLRQKFKDIFKATKIKEVSREEYVTSEKFGSGRVDLAIRFNSGELLIIENKIYSGDRDNQLNKYIDYYENNVKKVFYGYLTLFDKKTPSVSSLSSDIKSKVDERFRTLSYQTDIMNCINAALKSDGNSDERFKSACLQYKMGLGELLIKNMFYETIHNNFKEYLELKEQQQENLYNSVETMHRVNRVLQFFNSLMNKIKNSMQESTTNLDFLVNNLYYVQNQKIKYPIDCFDDFINSVFMNCDENLAFGIVCIADTTCDNINGLGIEYDLGYDEWHIDASVGRYKPNDIVTIIQNINAGIQKYKSDKENEKLKKFVAETLDNMEDYESETLYDVDILHIAKNYMNKKRIQDDKYGTQFQAIY